MRTHIPENRRPEETAGRHGVRVLVRPLRAALLGAAVPGLPVLAAWLAFCSLQARGMPRHQAAEAVLVCAFFLALAGCVVLMAGLAAAAIHDILLRHRRRTPPARVP